MYMSAIGFIISDVLMVLVILLNNTGPGWEVPVDTMFTLHRISLLLIFSIVFAILMLIIEIKKAIPRSRAFRVMYIVIASVTVAFSIFILIVNGFQGQFWFNNFPSVLFTLVSMSLVLSLFIAITVTRFKN